MKVGIVWFTTDLRLHDNETLVSAVEENDFVIPVYCWDKNFMNSTQKGFARVGSHRKLFLKKALGELDAGLKDLGIRLVVANQNPIEIFKELTKKYKINKVYTKKQVGFEEKLTNEQVKNYLFSMGVDFQEYSTSTLYHPSDLPFSISSIPSVFTKFRKLAEKETAVRQPISIPKDIKTVSHNLPLIDLQSKSIKHSVSPSLPNLGGEKSALNHLRSYLYDSKSILHYKETRNELFGLDFSSKLSPWLSFGCLSPKFIYHEIKNFEREYEANQSTYWLIFELLWRDFFRFSFKKHPVDYFKLHGIVGNSSNTTQNNPDLISQWINGKTSNNLVNASMIELKTTGWTSNRMRQIVASYFIHNLRQDWRIGAAYFEHILIDYDVSSNWGNWAYIAGVGNDPQSGRKFNLEKQEELYDKDKKYQRLWLEKTLYHDSKVL